MGGLELILSRRSMGERGETLSLFASDLMNMIQGLEVSLIRRIQGIGYGVLEFLRVGIMFDIFQNIHILYLEYAVLDFSGYGVLSLFSLWYLVTPASDGIKITLARD
ncbi:hypothetical protein Tco_0590278 [Tanacetum coccineum]